jgi:predicted site-specific integrase-resolvase
MHQLLTNREAAAYLGVAPETLNNWRCKGQSPAFIKTTPSSRGKVLYRMSDIAAWQDANLYASTSDVGVQS